MSGERIGNLLAGLGRITEGVAGEGYIENTRCGGALLYVSRAEAMGLAEKGVRWQIDPERIPEEGRHSWRMACGGEVLSVVRTADLPSEATPEDRAKAPKYRVTYGLCSKCSGWELAIRKRLRKEAEEAAKGGGGRRRGFREEADE